jgi:hypothetical protein
VLPACDLQAVLPECSQLPADVCETPGLLQWLPDQHVRSQVLRSRTGPRVVCGSRRDLCPGSGLCTGPRDVRCSLCSEVRSGSGSDLRGSVCSEVRCSGSGHLRRSLRSGAGELRCSLRSGCGEVLRHRLLQDPLLQCGSLRSRALDL